MTLLKWALDGLRGGGQLKTMAYLEMEISYDGINSSNKNDLTNKININNQ
jgi:hypothetical protein